MAAREATGLYFAVLRHRFDFDHAGLDRRDAVALRPLGGVLVLAVSDEQAVACGGVQTIGARVGEIKRMWARESWRGAGLDGRLLRHLDGYARHLGNSVVRLDANETLTEAIGLYERARYRLIDRYEANPYATHFFEKPLG
ncbi:MAG: GNAT family N-acetyltransferase [Candidatus Dormibacteraeota bacterium]|nr:GNAT family N-acetyltransferase [Candidatus Dormibacteraeota bacterium]